MVNTPSTFQGYLALGFSVVPQIPPNGREQDGKAAAVKWKPFQERVATLEEAAEWQKRGHNIAVVTGRLSGVVVIDTDSLEADERFHNMGHIPETAVVQTARGRHYYFNYPERCEVVNSQTILGDEIDVKGPNNLVTLPPSTHKSGRQYALCAGSFSKIADLPTWLMLRIRKQPEKPRQKPVNLATFKATTRHEIYARKVLEGALEGVYGASKGQRNSALNVAAFKIGQYSHILGRGDMTERLIGAAMSVGLDRLSSEKTIKSGLDAGEDELVDLDARFAESDRDKERGPGAVRRDKADPLTTGATYTDTQRIITNEQVKDNFMDNTIEQGNVQEAVMGSAGSSARVVPIEAGIKSSAGSAGSSALLVTPRKLNTAHYKTPSINPLMPMVSRVIHNWAVQMADILCCPLDALVIPAFSCMTGLIGNRIRIHGLRSSTKWQEPARFYGMFIGDPSVGKSHIIKAAFEPMEAIEKQQQAAFAKKYREYQVKLKIYKLLEKAHYKNSTEPFAEEMPPKPPSGDIIVDDITPEALAHMMNETECLTIYNDELVGFLGSFDRYTNSKGGENLILKAYGGGSHKVNRRNNQGQPLYVKDSHANVFGGIQPGIVRDAFGEKSVQNGLLARFGLMCFPQDFPPFEIHDTPLDASQEEAIKDYGTLGQDVFELDYKSIGHYAGEDQLPYVRLDSDAATMFHSLCAELDRRKRELVAVDTKDPLVGYIGKARGFALRLALVLHIIKIASLPEADRHGRKDVSYETMGEAITLVKSYFIPTWEAFVRGGQANENAELARKIVAYIKKKKLKRITTGIITRNYNNLSRAKATAALHYLEDCAWIFAEKTNTPAKAGRPADGWTVNELAHTTEH